MPTDLEKIMIYIETIKKLKLKYLADLDNRSMSNYIVKLIDKDIIRYEIENGVIKTDKQ